MRTTRNPVLSRSPVVVVLFCAFFHGVCHANDPLSGMINVKNLKASDGSLTKSATGDGQTDDTAAIQAAADLAKKRTRVVKPDDGSAMGSSPVIYFPEGRYVISDEIQLASYANVASDSKAIIEQKSANKRSFVFTNVFTITVRGLRFLGGSNQIYLENKNIDGTTLDISDCEFQGSSDYAVMTQGTHSQTDQHMSASLTISRCKFIRPKKVLRNVCDYAILRDTWVRINKENFDRDSAAFMNTSGTLMFDNMIGVPVFGTVNAQGAKTLETQGVDQVRWVDNYGNFIAQKSRFGGEYGGIPIVHHFGQPGAAYPFMGQTISIENSQICAGPNSRADSAVVTLRGGVPQLIRIVGNYHLVNGKYVLIEGQEVAAFLRSADAKKKVQVEIDSNMTFPTGVLPPELDNLADPRKKGAAFTTNNK